jgi:hypothetical protein
MVVPRFPLWPNTPGERAHPERVPRALGPPFRSANPETFAMVDGGHCLGIGAAGAGGAAQATMAGASAIAGAHYGVQNTTVQC